MLLASTKLSGHMLHQLLLEWSFGVSVIEIAAAGLIQSTLCFASFHFVSNVIAVGGCRVE
jgi:hypothetical protein